MGKGNIPPEQRPPSVADPVARQGGAEKREIYVAAFGSHLFYHPQM